MAQDWASIAGTDYVKASRAVIEDKFLALASCFAGTSAPTSPVVAGQFWLNTATGVLSIYDGSGWVVVLSDITSPGGGLLLLDGSAPMTGDLDMGTNLINNLGSGVASGDAVTKGQVDGKEHTLAIMLGTVSATDQYFCMVTRTDTTITAVHLVTETAFALHATNYWSAQVRNLTDANDLLANVKTTQTGGTNAQAITADTAWDFGSLQNATDLAAGKVLELQITKTGAPSNMAATVLFVHYKRKTA